ncbi:YheC/YheD family protein [Paenibacillus allorhizosphaerae]|uniref:Endospore coat-associated protein YheD n=1 Tax=Paenibacillus allorhizosphaerae TaxID=2849866 RepID=A0ABN7TKG9_9BACL|nr:YheC/YheD family protein [Paenibacillus allorhizosphaerae]CAG7643822.1 Endospore coat-associated protein YheD [Paenibacillus allorhizosphaerae]
MNKPGKGIKWEHYLELKKDNKLMGHLPDTKKLNKRNLLSMLSKYKAVYLKPNVGAFGIGIMRVHSIADGKEPAFVVHKGSSQKKLFSNDLLYAYVMKNRARPDYLVQQAIPLLQWKKRPFDVRLMMTKQRNNIWLNEGFVGRAANPKKIVTNIRSGGTAVSIDDLLAQYTDRATKATIIKKLNELGRRVCVRLEPKYTGIRLFGIDVGLDHKLKPWLIEANTRPEKICWKCLRKLYNKCSPLRK